MITTPPTFGVGGVVWEKNTMELIELFVYAMSEMCFTLLILVASIALLIRAIKRRRDYAIALEERVKKLERQVSALDKRTRRQDGN